jgi:ABC-2 type transport system ATP-binding protein
VIKTLSYNLFKGDQYNFMALLNVKNLGYSYGNFIAVDNISFTLEKGQILGFLGPNGAGKSTTMKMLSGVQSSQQGEIMINGFNIEEQPQQAKQCIGFLPEHPPLYLELSVIEFLHFCARLNNIAKNNCQTAIEKVLNDCGLEQVQKKLIGHLSKGYQQRLGIAQAIIHQPDIIILDEPTVGLDPIQINEIRSLIKRLGKDHAIILSTHILSEVSSVCTDVQIINHGKLLYKNQLSDFEQSKTIQYHLETAQTIELDIMLSIDGVSAIVEESENNYLLTLSSADCITSIIKKLHEKEWPLILFYKKTNSLESVFIDIINHA